MRRESDHPTQLASPTEGKLVVSLFQIAVRKEAEQVGQADVALSSVPGILYIGRDVGNPLLDGFRKILVGRITGRRRFDGHGCTPMLAKLMRILDHGVLGAYTSGRTFEVDGRRAGCSIGKSGSSLTDFPTTKLNEGLTETQIVLMSVLASEVCFQVNRKVAYLRVVSHQFKEDARGGSIHLELVTHIRLRRSRNVGSHKVEVVRNSVHIDRHGTFYIPADT